AVFAVKPGFLEAFLAVFFFADFFLITVPAVC
ncbi:MAG: hypothetical protein RJA70_3907, partial [Pseudomonadota bacterium]